MIQQQHFHSNHLGVLISFRCSAMRVATLFIPLLIASLMEAVVALSDDEDGPTGIEFNQNAGGSSRDALTATPKRQRVTRERLPSSIHDTRKLISRVFQSTCECSRLSRDKSRRSCFAHFRHVVEDLLNLRNKIHTLHKLDSDQFVAYYLVLTVLCVCLSL